MPASFLPRPSFSPAFAARQRFRAWWQARLPRTDTLELTQRNVYILPTPAGWMFALTLALLLLGSINYQLNLGYLLTFLLAGSAAVSMHLTHGNLRGLTLHLRAPEGGFAGDTVRLDVTLGAPAKGKARYGIGLRMESPSNAPLAWTDVPAGAQAASRVGFVAEARGRHDVPALCIETRFPLGLFRAWSVWRPAAQVLVYPKPEQPAAPLPAVQGTAGGPAARRSLQGGEVEGVRSYRRGDPIKLVAWKKAARSLAASGELVSRDTVGSVQQQLWLDWQQCGPLAPEDRLSRLTSWVLQADRAGAAHGLRLPGLELAPAQGDGHKLRCLEALALWR